MSGPSRSFIIAQTSSNSSVLEDEIRFLKRERDELTTKLNEERRKVASLEASIQTYQENISSLEAKNIELESQLKQANEEILKLRDRIAILERDLKNREIEISKLNKSMEELKKELANERNQRTKEIDILKIELANERTKKEINSIKEEQFKERDSPKKNVENKRILGIIAQTLRDISNDYQSLHMYYNSRNAPPLFSENPKHHLSNKVKEFVGLDFDYIFFAKHGFEFLCLGNNISCSESCSNREELLALFNKIRSDKQIENQSFTEVLFEIKEKLKEMEPT